MLRKTIDEVIHPFRSYHASMRPQRNAAENDPPAIFDAPPRIASMRPQRNAAENGLGGWWDALGSARFNEAAA